MSVSLDLRHLWIVFWVLALSTTFAQSPQGGGFGPPPGMDMREPMTPEEISKQESDWMKKKLKLNKEQYEKVSILNLWYASLRSEQMNAHQKQIPSPDELQKIKTEQERLDAEREEKFKLILTPDQWSVYQKKKKNMPQDIGMAPPGGMGFPNQ